MRIDKIEFERNIDSMDSFIQHSLEISPLDVSNENDFTHIWWENSIFLDEHNCRLAPLLEWSDLFNDIVTGNHPPVCKGPAVLHEDGDCWTFPSLKIEKYTFEDLRTWQERLGYYVLNGFKLIFIGGDSMMNNLGDLAKANVNISFTNRRFSKMIPETVIICDGELGKIRRRIRNVGPGKRILMSEMVCTGSPTAKLFREEWNDEN